MSEKLLITGGSGFVAFHIIEEAVKQGYEVYASVRKSSNVSHLQHLSLKFVYLDFTNVDTLVKQLNEEKYAYIIHSAGSTAAKRQEDYDLVNAQYAYNLALAATKVAVPVKKFVFVSSLAAIGPSVGECNILESNQPNPVTNYGRSKLKAEQMLAGLPQLPLITFRPTAVYGPRDKDIFIILKTFAGGFEPYIGSKPQILSFVYVKDLAKLLVDALKAAVVHKSYNISDGRQYGRYEMAVISKQILSKKTVRVHLPLGFVKILAGFLEATSNLTGKTPALNREKLPELTASWVCGSEAAKADLNYRPKYDLKAGLEESFKWYKEQKWL